MSIYTFKAGVACRRGGTLRATEQDTGGQPPVRNLSGATLLELIRYEDAAAFEARNEKDTISTDGSAPAARIEFGVRTEGRYVLVLTAAYLEAAESGFPFVIRETASDGQVFYYPQTGYDVMSIVP